MASRTKKLRLTIPSDPRPRGFDTSSSSDPPPLSTEPNTSDTFSYYSAFFSPRLLRPNTTPIYTIPPPSRDIDPSETEQFQKHAAPPPPPSSKLATNSSSTTKPRRLSKQLSMSETPRDVYWERHRRRQILQYQERRKKTGSVTDDVKNLTDEDLRELKGCIELGFGFNEENGQKLCNTLPALDLYFAVNRQLSSSSTGSMSPSEGREKLSSSSSMESDGIGLGKRSTSLNSNRADDMRRLFGSGDDPQQVKMKLRHWAQAVACSVMQSPNHPKNESNGRKSLS